MVKQRIAATLQVAGGVSLSLAGFQVSSLVGLVVAGVLAIVFGVALDLEHTPKQHLVEPDGEGRMIEKRGGV